MLAPDPFVQELMEKLPRHIGHLRLVDSLPSTTTPARGTLKEICMEVTHLWAGMATLLTGVFATVMASASVYSLCVADPATAGKCLLVAGIAWQISRLAWWGQEKIAFSMYHKKRDVP